MLACLLLMRLIPRIVVVLEVMQLVLQGKEGSRCSMAELGSMEEVLGAITICFPILGCSCRVIRRRLYRKMGVRVGRLREGLVRKIS